MDLAAGGSAGTVRGRTGDPARRRWPRMVAVATAVAAVVGLLGMVGAHYHRALLDTAGSVEFTRPLAVPPIAPHRLDSTGRKVFDLRLQAGSRSFFADAHTPTWGVNGDYLGPTLRATRGDQVLINVTNTLAEATTLHWHGMRVPAREDGGPNQVIAPGATWSPSWTVDQPAATLWYHPHPHGRTESHLYRGLGGIFLVDDPAADRDSAAVQDSAAVHPALPAAYGVDDVPLILQDRRFDAQRRFDERQPLVNPAGRLGDQILVNGTLGPFLTVTTQRIRLRLLNASAARTYRIGTADNHSFALIGTDGGLLPRPVWLDRIQLSPGERAEIVLELRPGERTVLRGYPPDLGTDRWTTRFSGGDDTLDLVELRAADQLRDTPPVPARLAALPPLPATPTGEPRRFRLGDMTINDRTMDPTRIDAAPAPGSVEVWEISNQDDKPHNLHLHGFQFRITDIGGRAPPAQLSGWKDTVYIRPRESVRIVVHFTARSEPAEAYLFHCHFLRHEDAGMMGQFLVVDGDRVPARLPGHGGHG